MNIVSLLKGFLGNPAKKSKADRCPYLVSHSAVEVASYAEIGVGKGDTVLKICESLKPNSSIHLFDFEERVNEVLKEIELAFPGKFKVYRYGNSHKLRDSYCWSLVDLISKNPGNEIFDYVYIDGAHDLTIDGFSFYLVDILLRKGGYIEFDDYRWTILKSPSVNPKMKPQNAEEYTEKQLATPHIELIINNLVKPHVNYEEIVENRVYRKIK